jgi:hypothetical protein
MRCLVEKPFILRVEETEELIETAKTRNLVLQVEHVERFNPRLLLLCRLQIVPNLLESADSVLRPQNQSHRRVLDLMIDDLDILFSLLKKIRLFLLKCMGKESSRILKILYSKTCLQEAFQWRSTERYGVLTKSMEVKIKYPGLLFIIRVRRFWVSPHCGRTKKTIILWNFFNQVRFNMIKQIRATLNNSVAFKILDRFMIDEIKFRQK